MHIFVKMEWKIPACSIKYYTAVKIYTSVKNRIDKAADYKYNEMDF